MKVTNLNKARKARARIKSKARAAENVVTFGRTKAEKSADKAQQESAFSKLEDHKRER